MSLFGFEKLILPYPLIDHYIYFYNHQRILLKTGVAPLMLRHSA